MSRKLFVIAPVFVLLLVASIVGMTMSTGGAAAQAGDDGVRTGPSAAPTGGLTLTVPTCANKGTVFSVQTNHPSANPVHTLFIFVQPTSGPPYAHEAKLNRCGRRPTGSG